MSTPPGDAPPEGAGPSLVETFVTELFGAVPEVRDHVVKAAEELLGAARAFLDAAERLLEREPGA